MASPLQTEKEFDTFVASLGFIRVSNEIDKTPSFKNADYVNKKEKIVIELKVLDKDHFKNGGVIDFLNALIIQPTNIDENGYGQYTFSLPSLNRENKNDSFEEPLRRILKKANRQIKETKQYYFSEKYSSGYIIIAQSSLASLNPLITAQLVKELLDREFSSIDGAIICSPYGSQIDPTTMTRNPECISVTKENNKKLKTECMRIADDWIKFYENNGHKST